MSVEIRTSDAGIGDPYWYEWSVGQKYVIEMLNPDSGIAGVTIQASGISKPLDDVNVHRSSGRTHVIQVKHTRSQGSFTFGDLVGRSDSGSLVRDLAAAWKRDHEQLNVDTVEIHTNCILSTQPYTLPDTGERRPALATFWTAMKAAVKTAAKLSDVVLPQELASAWTTLCARIGSLTADEGLQFLQQLMLRAGEPDLPGLKLELVAGLRRAFGVDGPQAELLLSRLDTALRDWATSARRRERITPEDVFEALAAPLGDHSRSHFLPPPEPFFESRQAILEAISRAPKEKKILFLVGGPGAGKTSIISKLANQPFSPISLRYHAFQPLSPESVDLNPDVSERVSPERFWRDLLDQLREAFRGRLALRGVPVRSDFLGATAAKNEVLRLSRQLAVDTGRQTIVAVDGIDHAARASGVRATFLQTLPGPEAVPDGVTFILAGQPSSMYPAYPVWLRPPVPEVETLEVPNLTDGDISAALRASASPLLGHALADATRIIAEYTSRNTLAVMFAVQEGRTCDTVDALTARLAERRLRSDLDAYYDAIWSALSKAHPELELTCVAAALTVLSTRVTPGLLRAAFQSVQVSEEIWGHMLRDLDPIVISERDGFRVLHNDVRLHLTRRIRQRQGDVRRAIDMLAALAASKGAPAMFRHADSQHLFELAQTPSLMAHLFTPEFVIEGAAIGRPLDELVRQGEAALRAGVALHDRGALTKAVGGLTTLSRLRADYKQPSVDDGPVPPVLLSERRVEPTPRWTVRILRTVLRDARHLLQSGDPTRARCCVA